MTPEETIDAVRQIFSPDNLLNVIDIKELIPIDLSIAQNDPNLSHFFALDENGPFSEIIERGFQSLRKGYYKITTSPYYRTSIVPGTFAADVYYYNNDQNVLFKYHANIGPLTNMSAKPEVMFKNHSSGMQIIKKFRQDKHQLNPNQDYRQAKHIFMIEFSMNNIYFT